MKPYIHEVKYYECDRMGITHHSNYIRFMEEARIDLQDQMGYSLGKMEEEGVVSPVVSLSCNYRKTTTFKDRIEIEVSIVNVSPLKMKLAYTMKVGEDIVFTGESVHCFLENGHPVRIDERFPVFTDHRECKMNCVKQE